MQYFWWISGSLQYHACHTGWIISPASAYAAKVQIFLGKFYKFCMFISKLSATALFLSSIAVSSKLFPFGRVVIWHSRLPYLTPVLFPTFNTSANCCVSLRTQEIQFLSCTDCKIKCILGLEEQLQDFCSSLTATCFSMEKNLIRETVHPYWCPDFTTLFHFLLHSAKPN